MEVFVMSTGFITITVILSIVIWIEVSREAVKPSEKIKWKKMMPLLSVGTLSTLIITISFFKNLSFFG